jgi:MoaA/NifB/PqqE/SkfB family radical SAM enzyme
MRLKKKVRIAKNFLLGRLSLKSSPFWIDFKLTDRCNLKCSYCTLWRRNLPEMTTKQILTLVDDVKNDCVLVYLSGGEPLLRKDIGKIIEHISKQDGMFAVLFTNGILIKQKIQEIRNIDLVTISLDGPKEVHDAIRGYGVFDRVIDAIRILKKFEIPVSVECVIHRLNVGNLKYITDFAKENKLHCAFTPIHTYEYSGSGQSRLLYERTDFLKAVKFLLLERRRNPWIINSRQSLDYWLHYPKQPAGYRCFAGTLYCNINPDGQLAPCFKRTALAVRREGDFTADFKKLRGFKKPCRCADCFCGNQIEYSVCNLSSIRHFSGFISRIKNSYSS